MVHKKSEYQLNYKWKPSQICRDIREAGHTYRVQRRLYDLSHLPLPWEVNSCKCDCSEDEDAEEAAHLPIPKTRLKHNILNEIWERTNQEQQAKQSMLDSQSASKLPKSDSWYRQLEEKEHRKPTDNLYLKLEEKEYKQPSDNWYRQMEKKEHRQSPAIMTEDIPTSKEISRQVQTKLQSPILADSKIDDYQGILRKPSPPTAIFNIGSPVKLSRGIQTVQPSGKTLVPLDMIRRDLQVSQPSKNVYCTCSTPKLMPYGWGSKADISDKKTFNVFAPTRHLNQFYPSALRAWKRREDDISKNIERECRTPQRRVTESAATLFNPTNVWMTEYQKQYTQSRLPSRPLTAPPRCNKKPNSIFHRYCT